MEYLIIVNDLDKNRIIKKISSQKKCWNLKVLGYKEFIKKIYFDYTNEAIVYIMEKYHVNVEIAKIYLNNLYYIEQSTIHFSKIDFLNEIYCSLKEKKLLIYNNLWKEKIKEAKIIFYHLNRKDKFFQKILLKCQKLTKVEIIEKEKLLNQKILKTDFETIEDEVIGVCNQICTLLKNGKKESEIYLTNLSETHRNLFNIYAPMFHLNINLKKKETYLSNKIVSDFIKNYSNDFNVLFKKLKDSYQSEKELEVINWLILICNRYVFVKNHETKKQLIFNDMKQESKISENKLIGIEEIDFYENEIDENGELFLLGVNEGIFPKIQKDESFLSDKEYLNLELNTIKEMNELEKTRCLHKLRTFAKINISCPKKDGKLELYPSSILEEINYEIINDKKEYCNSNQYNLLELAKGLDNYRKYGTISKNLRLLKNTYPNIKYNHFNNKYKKVNITHQKIKLSYSALDIYYHCSFRYYLNNILCLNEFEENFEQKIGNIFHEVLKNSYDENFDFESSWKKSLDKIKIENERENFFLTKLKKDLIRVINFLKNHEKINNFKIKTEEKIVMDFSDKSQLELSGIVDKILWKKKNENTLVSVVDYKTGNPNLRLDEINHGLGLQLPIYLTLIHQLPFQNIKVVGFYLQKILPSLPERDNIHSEEELKSKKLKLQGYSIDETSILQEFDSSFENSNLIASMKTSSKGFYPYSKVLSEEQMQKIIEIAKTKIKEAMNGIIDNNFEINPKRISGQLIGCEHCNYQSICYRKEENIIDLKEQKMNEFLGGDKVANLD